MCILPLVLPSCVIFGLIRIPPSSLSSGADSDGGIQDLKAKVIVVCLYKRCSCTRAPLVPFTFSQVQKYLRMCIEIYFRSLRRGFILKLGLVALAIPGALLGV